MSWSDIIAIANILLTVVLTVGVVYIGNKTSKIDKLEEKLETKNKEAIDVRFSFLASEINTPITMLKTLVEGMTARLEKGDDAFGEQGEKAHQLELATRLGISEQRIWTAENFASKEELEALEDSLQRVRESLIRCEERCGAKH